MSEQLPTIRREKVKHGGLRDEQIQEILEYVRQETPESVYFTSITTRQCDPDRKQFLIIDVDVRDKFNLTFKAGITETDGDEPDNHYLKKGYQEYDGPYTLHGLLDEITSLAETIHV